MHRAVVQQHLSFKREPVPITTLEQKQKRNISTHTCDWVAICKERATVQNTNHKAMITEKK